MKRPTVECNQITIIQSWGPIANNMTVSGTHHYRCRRRLGHAGPCSIRRPWAEVECVAGPTFTPFVYDLRSDPAIRDALREAGVGPWER